MEKSFFVFFLKKAITIKVLNRIVPEDNSLYKHTSEGK